MKIQLGDTIKDDKGREGEITNIGIATDKNDIAGESGVDAKEYDTELNYTGAISFQSEFGSYWCYFSQIAEVIKKNEFISDTSWMQEDSDIDIALNLEAEQQIGK
jgi:hypothetical protein|tara:strand:+ start:561 stop:875 length:315 start_codon:yes stop_codon:yes gene_type:complete